MIKPLFRKNTELVPPYIAQIVDRDLGHVLEMSVQSVEEALVQDPRDHFASDWEHESQEDGKEHLEIGRPGEGYPAQSSQLDELEEGEQVDLFLRHFPQVVGGRVAVLRWDEEEETFPELKVWQSGDSQEQKQSIENRDGYEVEWGWDHEERECDEEVS